MSLRETVDGLAGRMRSGQERIKDSDKPKPVCPPDLQEPDGSCPTTPDVISGGDSPPDTP